MREVYLGRGGGRGDGRWLLYSGLLGWEVWSRGLHDGGYWLQESIIGALIKEGIGNNLDYIIWTYLEF